jgi:hypothetical protein
MLECGRLFAWRHRSADTGGGKERCAWRRMAPGAGPGDRFNNNPPNQEHSHGKDLGGACSYLSIGLSLSATPKGWRNKALSLALPLLHIL